MRRYDITMQGRWHTWWKSGRSSASNFIQSSISLCRALGVSLRAREMSGFRKPFPTINSICRHVNTPKALGNCITDKCNTDLSQSSPCHSLWRHSSIQFQRWN